MFAFQAVLTNWIRTHSLDPTAPRRLVVRISPLRDGGKRADITVFDHDGVQVGSEAREYGASEECFRVLYWTAYDAATLLRVTTAEDSADKPEDSADKPEDSADKPEDSADKPRGDSADKPPFVKENLTDEQEKLPDVQEKRPQYAVEPPRSPAVPVTPVWRNHALFGLGLAGAALRPMSGFRLGVGRSFGTWMIEADARLSPPLVPMAMSPDISARPHAYQVSVAGCMRRAPLLLCALGISGMTGLVYEQQPRQFDERFADEADKVGGFIGLGLRAGLQLELAPRWAMRLDMDANFPYHLIDPFTQAEGWHGMRGTFLTAFISLVPSF